MRRLVAVCCVLGTALPALSPTKAAHALPGLMRVDARLWLGHDSNLLDISDPERALFENGDEGAFFAVDRMSDQFFQGDLRVEWEVNRGIVERPSLRLGWERRQYVHDPIKSEDQLTLGVRTRPGERTRLDLQAGLRPQVYNRHRFDGDALPGAPQFRPEVYRRWDLDFTIRQGLDRRTEVDVQLEGTLRRYRAPFEERDRESFGGGGGLTRSFGRTVSVRGAARYRATWTRNDPWDPDDRSHRDWRATSGVAFTGVPFLKAVSLEVDLDWRRFTSTNPDDQDHFGRRDRGGEAELEIVRGLASSLDWISRSTWRWRSSDFLPTALDEEGIFEEWDFRTGVMWGWKQK
jgi:hypothetical protein